MSERAPRVTADDLIRVLLRLGFDSVRSSGGHRIYRNAAGRRATVPYHRGRILHPKIVAQICRDAEITTDELATLLRG